jgi:hypothetical protein
VSPSPKYGDVTNLAMQELENRGLLTCLVIRVDHVKNLVERREEDTSGPCQCCLFARHASVERADLLVFPQDLALHSIDVRLETW